VRGPAREGRRGGGLPFEHDHQDANEEEGSSSDFLRLKEKVLGPLQPENKKDSREKEKLPRKGRV